MLLLPATEADYATIVNLVNWAFRGRSQISSWTVESDVIAGKRITDELLREDIIAKPEAHLLILRDTVSGPLLGNVWLEPQTDGVWYLGLLTVCPMVQNRQLGRRLLNASEQFAKERGARLIRITVISVRDTLIAWYVRRGYTLMETTKPFPYQDKRFGQPLRDDLHFCVMEKAVL